MSILGLILLGCGVPGFFGIAMFATQECLQQNWGNVGLLLLALIFAILPINLAGIYLIRCAGQLHDEREEFANSILTLEERAKHEAIRQERLSDPINIESYNWIGWALILVSMMFIAVMGGIYVAWLPPNNDKSLMRIVMLAAMGIAYGIFRLGKWILEKYGFSIYRGKRQEE